MMRPDMLGGPDAQEIAEIEREARAAEKRAADEYWAKVRAGEVVPPKCEHPYPIAGRCVGCAREWAQVCPMHRIGLNAGAQERGPGVVTGCRCGLQLGHGGDCQDGGAL